MTTRQIDYARPERAGRSRRRWVIGSLLVAALGLGLFVPVTQPVRQVRSRIDAVTGSMEWMTTGPGGVTSGPVVQPSGLEKRLLKMGLSWKRDWRFLHNVRRTMTGRAVGYECGLAPPIMEIQVVLTAFAGAATDEEIREFVRVMRTGTEAEQRAAVEAAGEKGLRAMGAGR
jgi:hypothetical protein